MVKVIYTYEVSKERQDEYLKVTKDTIKSFWESHRCDAYTIWSPNGEPTKFVKVNPSTCVLRRYTIGQ